MDGKEHYRRYGSKSRVRAAQWRKDNAERHLARQKEWRKENAKKRQEYEKLRRRNLRQTLLAHYGTSCRCCGESREEALCFDHVDGGGEAHRRKVGSGTRLQWWLLRSGFPSGFQVLCHNCNFCKWAHGRCLHEGPPIKTGGTRYAYMKELRNRVRLQVLRHYSSEKPTCAICSEDQSEFLVLDHVNGGGKKHQKEVGRGSSFYRWIAQNLPPGFQVLCHNCNFVKS